MDPIDPNKPIQKIIQPERGKAQSKTGKLSFNEVFKHRLGAESAQSPAPESLTLASSVHPAQFSGEPQFSGSAIVQRINQLVDTMEVYQMKLAERGATLKEMDPLIQQMETQSGSLSAISKTAEGQDDKLQAIIDHSLMLSTLEITRYRSGHYCDG